jgi:hypothetical protein
VDGLVVRNNRFTSSSHAVSPPAGAALVHVGNCPNPTIDGNAFDDSRFGPDRQIRHSDSSR